MTPKAALNVLLGLLLLIALSAGFFAVRSYNKAVETAAALPELRKELAAAQAAHAALAEEVVKRSEIDRLLRAERAATNQRLNEVSASDTAAGDYLRTRIPDDVRRALVGDDAAL